MLLLPHPDHSDESHNKVEKEECSHEHDEDNVQRLGLHKPLLLCSVEDSNTDYHSDLYCQLRSLKYNDKDDG